MNQSSKYKGNILLIDDLSDNLELFSELLLLGYNVRSITVSKIKSKTLRIKNQDVILLNINNSEINYYQICDSIKNYKHLTNIPIIFIVSLYDVFDKLKAFEVGITDYITRPFNMAEVVSKLETQLTIKRERYSLEEEVKKRKQIEEILNHSRALLLSILNSSLDGVAALQSVRHPKTKEIKDFRCLVVNPIFAKLFNRSQSDKLRRI